MVASSKPAEKIQLKGRTGTGINWTGAFLLYTKGATLTEIADQMGIPIAKLKTKFREEDWEGMVVANRDFQLSAPAPAQSTAVELAHAGKRIEQNREDGLAVVQRLRDHIRKILDDVDLKKSNLDVSEIRALTQAVTSLNTAAMLALGDDPAPKFLPPPTGPGGVTPAAEDPKKDKRPTMIFNIHLPKVAQQPRAMRTVAPAGEVHGAKPVDAFTPMPPAPAVIEPVAVESEVVDLENGRASVNFEQLAANSKPAETFKGASGIPAFFTT